MERQEELVSSYGYRGTVDDVIGIYRRMGRSIEPSKMESLVLLFHLVVGFGISGGILEMHEESYVKGVDDLILYPPVKFDLNEWAILAIMFGLGFTFFTLPRRLFKPMTIVIWLFYIILGRTADRILGSPSTYDFYDSMDTPNYDLFDVLMLDIVFPLYGYLFCYFYDRLNVRGMQNLLYILAWAVVSALAEGLSVLSHVYVYKNGWNLMHSFFCYLVIFPISILFYRIATHFFEKTALKK